jgi:hypothetical protein
VVDPAVEQSPAVVPAVLPRDVVRTPAGQPAVLVVRSGRGWTVLGADADGGWSEVPGMVGGDGDALSLVEAMSLADLVAAEQGLTPEPGREARRAARSAPAPDTAGAADTDPRDEEIATLRRTVGQLEHALAARVSVERAIGVLAERHGTTPRAAFEELRRRARSQGRAAHELAAEVLDELAAAAGAPATPGGPVPGTSVPGGVTVGRLPAPEPRPAQVSASARRVQRNPRRAAGGDAVPGTPR